MTGSLLLICGLLWATAVAANPKEAIVPLPEPPRFRIDAPARVLSDVPVRRVVITALTPEGVVDANFNGQPYITGLRLAVPSSDDAKLGAFSHGILDLATDLTEGRKVYVTDSEILVDPEGRIPVSFAVRRINRWWSLLPLLVATGLAVWLRNTLFPLLAALFCGALVLSGGNLVAGFLATFDTYLLGAIVPRSGAQGLIDHSHLHVLIGTLFLGALAGVLSAGGGTAALSARLERFSRTRSSGQLLGSAFCGLAFFDQAVNCLVVGPLLRPISDQAKISREKLAFLCNSVGGSLAGLVVISLFLGTELSAVRDAYSQSHWEGQVFTALLASIPFRFYPIYLLVFVVLVAFLEHDFGPMLRAETRAFSEGHLLRTGSLSVLEPAELPTTKARRELAINLLVPVATFAVLVAIGLWWTGSSRLAAFNEAARHEGVRETARGVVSVLEHSTPGRVLFLSSFLASAMAVVMMVCTRALSFAESLAAWCAGARSLLLPLIMLVLAWAVARICDETHLNTAGFLMEIGHFSVSPGMMPALAFILAAVVAMATGSQVLTVALLMPLVIAVAHGALVDLEQAGPTHRLMLATIGAVMTGSLCGGQCSLFSQATILSSAGAGADHFDHVATQLPYALAVGGISLVLGYIPAGMGYSPGILLPLGTLALFVLVQFLGRPASELSGTGGSTGDAPPSALDAMLGEIDAVKLDSGAGTGKKKAGV